METYNIYLVNTDTFKAERLLGSDATLEQSELMQNKYEGKFNALNEFILVVETGSQRDLELAKDLKHDK